MKHIALFLIRVYWFLGKIFPFSAFVSCRFYPSCSHYAYQSIEKKGIIKGGLQAIKRILRCHPWSKGGVDYP